MAHRLDKIAIVNFTPATKEKKMKVYEAILVQLDENGEIGGAPYDQVVIVANSPQRARDMAIRAFAGEIAVIIASFDEWDIIVREFK